MNVLNKQGTGYVPIGIDLGVMQNDKTHSRNELTILNEPILVIKEVAVGLCINCDNNSYCMWQKTNKMFCEHYQ